MDPFEEDRHFNGYCPTCGQVCHCGRCLRNTLLRAYAWAKEEKKELVRILGLKERGQFDYAIPQPWLDDLKEITGVYAIHCFVWFYPKEGEGRIFGHPYPLTDEGRFLLNIYNNRRGTNYPIY